jgi:hypothetical protein
VGEDRAASSAAIGLAGWALVVSVVVCWDWLASRRSLPTLSAALRELRRRDSTDSLLIGAIAALVYHIFREEASDSEPST